MSRSPAEEEISWPMSMPTFLTATKPTHILTLVCQIIISAFSANILTVNKFKLLKSGQMKLPQPYKTYKCTEWKMFRDAATQDNNISLKEYTSSLTS